MADIEYRLNHEMDLSLLAGRYCAPGKPHNVWIRVVRNDGTRDSARLQQGEVDGLLHAGILEELQPEMPPGLL